jgi:hypothetical protein
MEIPVANVRDWLYWRLMQDFGVRGGGEYTNERGTVFGDDSTKQFYEWTKMTHASWADSGITSCTSFLYWVHKPIVDEGFAPAGHWDELPKLRGWHTGTQGAQSGVLLDISGNVAEYLAGGADNKSNGRIAWSRDYVPPPSTSGGAISISRSTTPAANPSTDVSAECASWARTEKRRCRGDAELLPASQGVERERHGARHESRVYRWRSVIR